MTPEKIKATHSAVKCVDCKYFSNSRLKMQARRGTHPDWMLPDLCERPSFPLSLVTGELLSTSAEREREKDSPDACGFDGKFFEKEPEPYYEYPVVLVGNKRQTKFQRIMQIISE